MVQVDDQTRMKPSETLADFEQRLKELGKKPVVLVVDDDSTPDFESRIKARSIRTGQSPSDRDIDDFIEQGMEDTLEDEPPYENEK